jgi:hypothetical protein
MASEQKWLFNEKLSGEKTLKFYFKKGHSF